MHLRVVCMQSCDSTNRPAVVMGDETWSRQKSFNFLQPAWSVTAAAPTLFVSFSSFKFNAQFKCSQMLTGAAVNFCEICADLLSGSSLTPCQWQLPCSRSFELRKAESVHGNVFEIKGELKTGGAKWEETKRVNERRWFTSSRQTNCNNNNNSGRLIELQTD